MHPAHCPLLFPRAHKSACNCPWLTWQRDRPHCAPRTRPGAVSDSAHIHARLPQPATCLGRNNRSPLQSIGRPQPNCAPSTLAAAISDSAPNPCATAAAPTCPGRITSLRAISWRPRPNVHPAHCLLLFPTAHPIHARLPQPTLVQIDVGPIGVSRRLAMSWRPTPVASQPRSELSTDSRYHVTTTRQQWQPIHDRAACHGYVVQPLLWLRDWTQCRQIAAPQ